VAYLSGGGENPATTSSLATFREGLSDLGYRIGQDVVVEEHFANGENQIAEFSAELARLQPEVIVVPAATVARAVHAATTIIPIVSVGQEDLREKGLVDNLARPTGNVTGMSSSSLVGKSLQLLQEAVPTLRRVTAMTDATIGSPHEPYQVAASTLGLQIKIVDIGSLDQLDLAFDAAVRDGVDGLILSGGPFIQQYGETRIVDLALQHRLPTMWTRGEPVLRGGLMGYGANRPDLYRRAATYVDKLLKGARPTDLPIEQPSLFDLAINVRTAQTLGLNVAPSVLAQATELIQ
jgi:putative ABC transport system substrate-binding protein